MTTKDKIDVDDSVRARLALSRFASGMRIHIGRIMEELGAARHMIGSETGKAIIGSGFHACIDSAEWHIQSLKGLVAHLHEHEPTTVARYCLPWVSDNLKTKENDR